MRLSKEEKEYNKTRANSLAIVAVLWEDKVSITKRTNGFITEITKKDLILNVKVVVVTKEYFNLTKDLVRSELKYPLVILYCNIVTDKVYYELILNEDHYNIFLQYTSIMPTSLYMYRELLIGDDLFKSLKVLNKKASTKCS